MKLPNLNRRLTLEAPQDVPDGAGGFDRIWMPMGEHWAEVTFASGRETSNGPTAVAQNALRIVVRASPVGTAARPLPSQRFREGTRVYRIETVAEADQAGRFLMCRAQEELVA